jgi:diguanylate cyclase (GGDEF)-like protein/PAS domain S-box-containing protein
MLNTADKRTMNVHAHHIGCGQRTNSLRDFATCEVVRQSVDNTIGEAAEVMADQRISSVVVTDANNHPVGIVTERNILRAMQSGHQPDTQLQHVMSSPVITVDHNIDCQQAYRLCLREGIRHLVLIDAEGELTGVASETDFRLHMNLEALAGVHSVVSVMSRSVLSLPPDSTLREALNLMQAQRDTCVLVVDDGQPVGIVTERDVVRLYSRNPGKTDIPLSRVMAAPVISVTVNTTLNEAAERMLASGTRHLAVVNEGGRLAGLIGEHELTQSIAHELSDTLLDDKENFLRTLINTIPDLVWLKDPKGTYLTCNTAFEKLFGVTEGNILGRTDYDFVDRNLADFFRQHDQQTMAAGKPCTNNEWLTFPDGYRGLFETVKSPMVDHNGRLIGVLGVARDITAIHEAKEAMRESELKLRNLIAVIPDAVQFKDGEGRWLEYNAITAESFGLAHIDCHGKSDTELAELALPEFRDALLNCHGTDSEVWAAGTMQHVEEVISLPDGNHLVFEVLKVPLFNDDRSRKGLVIIGRDITHRKQTEMALQDSLQTFNDLVVRIPVGVFKYRTRADGSHSFDYISPRWCEISGIPAEEVYRNAQVAFSHVFPDDLAGFQQAMADAIATMQDFEYEIRVLRGGETRWLLIEARPNRQANGDIVWDGMQYDNTERRQADEHRRLTASVFTDTHEGIVITDPEACIVEVNDAFSRITGYSREEVLGKNPATLKSGHQGSEFYQEMWRAIIDNGQWSGEVWNRRKGGEVYAEHLTISAVRDERGGVSHYAGVFADITPQKEYERKLEKIAHYDALTGVPNRALLADRMQQAVAQCRRAGGLLAICYLDLDGFKPVNDLHGHETGDLLLVEMARRMQQCIRGGDTVARIGGDEFVLLMGLSRLSECDTALKRLLGAIARPTLINGIQVGVSASLGVTLYPADDADPDTLLRHADQAMYLAKQGGKNRYHIYDPEHDRQVKAQRDSLQRLAEALEAFEFEMHYQPKVNLQSRQVSGVEALIRWRHPDRGLLLPDEFLPHLMGTELEIAVGEWVIESVMRQVTDWKAQGINLTVSINISADHLLNPGFIDHLRTALKRHPDISSGDLELEILESAAITDLEQASRVLVEGEAMGLQFSLDDFGTGYSSLSYFSKLPVDTLKIDREFVRNMLTDPEDLSIVESVVFLALAFNRNVVAEGVETAQHYAMLLHLGCPFGQGFGIANPMPPGEMQAWLGDWYNGTGLASTNIIELPREDVVLIVAAASHREWIDRVAAYLNGTADERPPMNAHQCRFGRWYHGIGHSRYGKLAEYTELDPLHHQIHERAWDLVALVDNGERDTAMARIQELYTMRDEFLAGLDRLIEKVRTRGIGKQP